MRNSNIVAALLLLLAMSIPGLARKAQGGNQLLQQPDGSSFVASLTGDEFCHILTTAGGSAVVQDEDGWYSYALFDSAGQMRSSGVHVGAPAADPDVLRASSAIPYAQLGALARRTREMIPDEDMNLIRRMNARFHADGGVMTKSSSTGITKHGLVILVNFSDVSFRKEHSDFVDLLTLNGYSVNGAVGCAKEYFDAQFGGLYDFDFEVVGPVTVSQKRSYYGGNDSDGQDKNPEQMVVEACRLVDPEVDFSLFDDDEDGEIDNVFIFFAGGDEAEYAGDDCIWSHAWYIKDGAGIDVTLDSKVLNRYACTSELMTKDHGKSFSMAPIGTFCHEYSHTLGLVDLYDTDYENSTGTSEALWYTLSLMDAGNMNGDGNIPPYYTAIEREMLGLGECLPLAPGAVALDAIDVSNIYYKVEGELEGEFFLLECRRQQGWDAAIGGEGLLLYHVDRSRNKAGISSSTNRTLTAAQRWAYNEVNANPSHQCADLVEADPGARSPASTSVKRVFFPYSKYNSIVPGDGAMRFWDGTDAPFRVTNIRYSDGTSTFNVIEDGSPEEPPTVENIVTDVFQDAAVISFEPSAVFGAVARVSWGESGKQMTELELSEYEEGKYALVLEGLSCSTSYKATIWFETEAGLAGVAKTVSFLTASSTTSSYPYIYLKSVSRNSDGSFSSASRLPLRIYNPGNSVDGIFWYFNGSPVTIGASGYWNVPSSGLLQAEIIHKDGTKNIVAKQINMGGK